MNSSESWSEAAPPATVAGCLSPEWLCEVLGQRLGPVEIERVHIKDLQETVATKVRLAIDYSSSPPDAPSNVCVKGYFGQAADGKAANAWSEAQFYAHHAPSLTLNVPRCFGTGIDPTTELPVIVMEDLVARGAQFLSAASPYSVDQAALSLDQLARLHSAQWGLDLSAAGSWHPPRRTIIRPQYVDRLRVAFRDGRGAGLPAFLRDAFQVWNSADAVVSMAQRDIPCLVHGDAHAGNVFEAADGTIGLVDWQLFQTSSWAIDVAYHLPSVLTIEDRAQNETDLLKYYLGRLVHHGVPQAPSWETAWLQYRRSLSYGYLLWVITRMVEAPIVDELVDRLGCAVAAHHRSS